MEQSSRNTRRTLLESPWYWVYLFCTAGLIALAWMGPKFSARQTQIEQNYRARGKVSAERSQQASENSRSTDPASSTTAAGHESNPTPAITLSPLYVILGLGFALAWIMVWRQLFWRRDKEFAEAKPSKNNAVTNVSTHVKNNP